MRKLILKMSVSLDGYVAGPGGDMGWLFRTLDDGATNWIVDTISEPGVHLMGSVTYRAMAAHWPTSTEPFAPPMNEIPKVVFSNSMTETRWADSTIVRGDLAEEVARLKREPGKDLLAHGGARFARSLSKLGLIDEYRLVTHPVILGGGERLFPDLDAPADLRLMSTTPFCGGAVAHVYRRA